MRAIVTFFIVVMLLVSTPNFVVCGQGLVTRFAPMAINIKKTRSATSKSIDVVEGGDPLRVGLLKNNWYAVFPLESKDVDKSKILGYVYAPLLRDARPKKFERGRR